MHESFRIVTVCLAASLFALPVQSTDEGTEFGLQAQQQKTPTSQAGDALSQPDGLSKPPWRVVLSQWSMHGTIFRERPEHAGLGIESFIDSTNDLDIDQIELSSQLVEADLRRIAVASDQEVEAESAEPQLGALERLATVIVDLSVSHVSIDHLRPLRHAELEDESNVSDYARWIVGTGMKLGTRSFSLVVDEDHRDRETAKNAAELALTSLCTSIADHQNKEGLYQQEDEDSPDAIPLDSNTNTSSDETGESAPTESLTQAVLDRVVTPNLKEPPPIRILIESGPGYRSDPRWLAEIVNAVRASLRDSRLNGRFECAVLVNLARHHGEFDDDDIWIEWATELNGKTDQIKTTLGGVIAETRAFIVKRHEHDKTQVRILAERFVDYHQALRILKPIGENDLPIIVRYVGPTKYETSGMQASTSLFKTILRVEASMRIEREQEP